MWERRCGSVPVVDEAGDVVGMVTDRDVSMAAYTQGRRLDDIAVSIGDVAPGLEPVRPRRPRKRPRAS